MSGGVGSNSFIIDEIGKIAESANMNVVVRENQLRLVNRNQDAANITQSFRMPQLLKIDVTQAMPIRRVISEYEQNIPYPHSRKLERQIHSAQLQIQPYGQDVNVDSLSQVETEVEKFLSAYYEIEKRPRTKSVVDGIFGFQIGDKLEFFDEVLEIKAVCTLDVISWNFKAEQTTLQGPSIITHVKDV